MQKNFDPSKAETTNGRMKIRRIQPTIGIIETTVVDELTKKYDDLRRG